MEASPELQMPAFDRVREEFMRKLSLQRHNSSDHPSSSSLKSSSSPSPPSSSPPMLANTFVSSSRAIQSTQRSLSSSLSGELIRSGSAAAGEVGEEVEDGKLETSIKTDAIATVAAAAEIGRTTELVEALSTLGYEATDVISEVTYLNDFYSEDEETHSEEQKLVRTVNFMYDLIVVRLSRVLRSQNDNKRFMYGHPPSFLRLTRNLQEEFPWPLIDMAEFEFGKKHTNRSMKNTVVLVNLPRIPESSIPKLRDIIFSLLGSMASEKSQLIHFPLTATMGKSRNTFNDSLDLVSNEGTHENAYSENRQSSCQGEDASGPDEHLKGVAFLSMDSEKTASAAADLLDKFPWPLVVPTDLVSGLLVKGRGVEFLNWKTRLFREYGKSTQLRDRAVDGAGSSNDFNDDISSLQQSSNDKRLKGFSKTLPGLISSTSSSTPFSAVDDSNEGTTGVMSITNSRARLHLDEKMIRSKNLHNSGFRSNRISSSFSTFKNRVNSKGTKTADTLNLVEEGKETAINGDVEKFHNFSDDLTASDECDIKFLAKLKNVQMSVCGLLWGEDDADKEHSRILTKSPSLSSYTEWVDLSKTLTNSLASRDAVAALKAELEHNRIVSTQYHKYLSDKNPHVRRVVMEGFVELDESIYDHLGKLSRNDESKDTSSKGDRSVLQMHTLISNIRSSIQAKLLYLSEKRNHEIQLQLDESNALRLQYEGKLKVSWDQNRSLQRSHQMLRDRLEELETTLSYHRLASERLRTTERKLEESERERISLERRLTNLSAAHERAEKEAAIASHRARGTISRKIRVVKGDFEDGKARDHLDELFGDVLSNLESHSDDDLTAVEEQIHGMFAEIRDIKEKRLRARTEELEKRHEAIDSSLCCVCVESPRSVLLLPCRHLCVCEDCARSPQLNSKCPMCRATIIDTIKVYCA